MLSKDLLQMFRKYKLWPEYRGSDLKSRTSEFFGFLCFPFVIHIVMKELRSLYFDCNSFWLLRCSLFT